jgi:hypothetical protein
MFLSDWRVLLRRWYIVLVGLSLTAMLGVAVTVVVPAKYQATSSVLFLPPQSDTVAQGGNPFLALGGLETVAGVVARTVSDSTVQDRVKAAGGTGEYTVAPDATAGGPVLLITVEARTPAAALKTLAVVLRQLPQTLAALQTTSGVPQSSLIRSKEITRDPVAKTVLKPLMRAMIAAVAFGLGLTVLGAALIDSLIRRRTRQRRTERRARESGQVDAPAGADRRPVSAGLDMVLPAFDPNAVRPVAGVPERRRPHLVTAVEMADDTVEFGRLIPAAEGLRPAEPGGSPAQAGQA